MPQCVVHKREILLSQRLRLSKTGRRGRNLSVKFAGAVVAAKWVPLLRRKILLLCVSRRRLRQKCKIKLQNKGET